jgi:hypothetical protein
MRAGGGREEHVSDTARDSTDQAENAGREAEQSDWLDHAVRAGLIAYGIVHLMLGWLAVQLALGHQKNASTKGALQTLRDQPFGGFLVWAVAVGMFLLVVWRVIEAGFGHRDESDDSKRLRKRVTSGGKAVIYGALGISAVRVATGSSSSGGGSKGMTAKLMGWPAGPWLVGLIGLAIIAYGANTAWRGWKEKFAEHLDAQGKMGRAGAAYLVFGKVGYIAKGISLAIVGALFVFAGIDHNASKSGGLDQALQKVLQAPFGAILIAAIGLGLACYGLFCFARARHLNR